MLGAVQMATKVNKFGCVISVHVLRRTKFIDALRQSTILSGFKLATMIFLGSLKCGIANLTGKCGFLRWSLEETFLCQCLFEKL